MWNKHKQMRNALLVVTGKVVEGDKHRPRQRTALGSDSEEGAKRATWGRNEAESGKSEIKCEHACYVWVRPCALYPAYCVVSIKED